MEKIFSQVEPSKLLHFVHRLEDFSGRQEIIEPDEVLQLASLEAPADNKYRAHKHIPKHVGLQSITAQESWVVLRGSVLANFFDLDDRLLSSVELNAGDVSVTLSGGHSYEILEDALVLEFKTGPYLGQAADKVFLD